MCSFRVGLVVMSMLAAVAARPAAGAPCREEELDAEGKCPKPKVQPKKQPQPQPQPKKQPQKQKQPTQPPPKEAQQPTQPNPAACPADMIRIPAGTGKLGVPDQGSERTVTLSAYCIDKTEVTVRAYAACVAAKGCAAPSLKVNWFSAAEEKVWARYCNRTDRPDHPINCVDWSEAAAYCKASGKRLPTEAEWELAARGSDGRPYPWGAEVPRGKRLNACGAECQPVITRDLQRDWSRLHADDDGWEATAPVGSFPGDRSPHGVLDLAGNVQEWTADWYDGDVESATDPRGPETGDKRVIHGGGWTSTEARSVRAAERMGLMPAARFPGLGFRCARGD